VIILCLGLILFFVPHLSQDLGIRQRIINALPSQAAYMGLYSLVSLSGIALIVWGKSIAEFTMVWQPIFELRMVSHVLMIPAAVLVVAGNLPMSNLRKYLRNPMLLGVTFWGLAHLWSNGDLASIILFLSFTLWAGFKFLRLGEQAKAGDQGTTQQVKNIWELLKWDTISLICGLSFYVVISLFHGQLFGVGLDFVQTY
jgi:uncharacterized membrane protein